MRPFISVVIPAHNPGRYIEPCIRSLLRQSMSRDRFEVVFVDDGSTDGTAERLSRLAREQPHVRVIHIPASGAPGRPRNVGLEAALGEYVQFLDADDELAPRALQRLIRMAHANRSDVVLGKFASETMTRRQDLFTRNRGATTLNRMPQLLDGSLGPTKLFRTALLRANEISFPEGWRQMEDQLFTLRAYLAASVISILGDEPCYFFNKREDEGHISAELVDPELHAAHLGEILDEAEGGLADEALRQRFTTRLYRTEVLGRLGDSQFLGAPAEYQHALFEAVRALTLDRFADRIGDGLGAIARVRSRLLLEGRFEATVLLAHRTGAFTVDTRVTRARWTNGRLGLEFGAILARGADAHPLTVIERDGAILLDPAIADDLVGPVDVTDELRTIRAQVSVVDRDTALEWIVPGGAGLTLRAAGGGGGAGGGGAPGATDGAVRIPTLRGLVELDPQRVGPGEMPLDDGSWDVLVRWSGLGSQSAGVLRLPLRQRRQDRPPIPPALVGKPVRWVVPRADADGALRLAIGGADRLPASIDDASRRVIRDGAAIAIGLPIATDRSGQLAGGVLRLSGAAGVWDLPASFDGSLGSLVVSAAPDPATDPPPRGRYEATAHLGIESAPGLPVATVIVGEDGRLALIGIRRVSSVTRFRGWASWTTRSLMQGLRARALGVFRRLPPSAKDAIRSAYARLRG